MNQHLKLALILLGFVASVWLGLTIKHWIDDSGYEKAKIYNTAVQADDADRFNYAIDSRQGNVLGSGTFTAKEPIQMEGVRGEYYLIQKTKERYTQHEETYECGTEDNPRTCTRIYYTWDYAGSDTSQVPMVTFHNREYQTSLFSVSNLSRLDCEVIQVRCKSGYSYQDDRGWFGYSVGDIRYYYKAKEPSFFGTILVNTSNGLLEPILGHSIEIQNTDITTAIEQANKIYGGVVFFIIWIVVSLIVSGVLIKVHFFE